MGGESNLVHRNGLGTSNRRRRSSLAVILISVAVVAGLVVPMNAVWAAQPTRGAVVQSAPAAVGMITTFAGGGVGDGALASRVQLGNFGNLSPWGLAVDGSGNVLFTTSREA